MNIVKCILVELEFGGRESRENVGRSYLISILNRTLFSLNKMSLLRVA